jgi:hypothetical protein
MGSARAWALRHLLRSSSVLLWVAPVVPVQEDRISSSWHPRLALSALIRFLIHLLERECPRVRVVESRTGSCLHEVHVSTGGRCVLILSFIKPHGPWRCTGGLRGKLPRNLPLA